MPLTRGRRPLRGRILLTALAAWLVGAAVPAQEAMTVPVAEAPSVARAALASGRPDVARSLALGLLKADARDFTALAILSAAEAQRGAASAAAAAGRRAYRLAGTASERFEAAMLTAGALSTRDRLTGAQWWLRRAVHHAPSDVAEAAAVRQFRQVRSANPLSAQLQFGVAPTSNINNGARSDTVDVLGLPFQLSPAAQALSGTEFSAAGALRYRLGAAPHRATHAGLSLQARAYRLSGSARAQVPDLSGSDFAFQRAEATLDHRWRAPGARAVNGLALRLGRTWFGGSPLADIAAASVSRSGPLRPGLQLGIELEWEGRSRRDRALFDSDTWRVTGRLDRSLPGGDDLQLAFGLRDTRSAADTVDHRALIAGVQWRRAEPVAGIGLSARLDLEWRDYGAAELLPGDRQDLHASVGLVARFERADYMGFVPTLGLQARGVFSDLAIYDTREVGLRAGIASRF